MTPLTPAAIESALQVEAPDDFVELLEVTFPGQETMRFVNQAVERLKDADGWDLEDDYGNFVYGLVHQGTTYTFLNFHAPWPSREGGKAPESTLEIDNMTRELIPYIRNFHGQADVVLKLVHTSDIDIVQEEFRGLKWTSVDYEEETISAKLGMDYLTGQAYPALTYTPDWCPGAF